MHLPIQNKLTAYLKQEGLPLTMLDLLEWFYLPLVDQIANRHQTNTPMILGINGAQGSGKSTLAGIICLLLNARHGLRCASLSLDDLYLTKAERQILADEVHPLFITRGVPGTHDLVLGNHIFDRVLAGQSVVSPRFDKLTDERADPDSWSEYENLDLLILEGWCVACLPQSDTVEPINHLELEEDQDGRWRNHVNECLLGEYASFFSRLDTLLMLAVPSMQKVFEWRELQEQKLEQRQGRRGMKPAEVMRFIMHYERLTRWMLHEMPPRADILVPIGDDHAPMELTIHNSS